MLVIAAEIALKIPAVISSWTATWITSEIFPVFTVGNPLTIPSGVLAELQECYWDSFTNFWLNPPGYFAGIYQTTPAGNPLGILADSQELLLKKPELKYLRNSSKNSH